MIAPAAVRRLATELSAGQRWLVAALATIASTYALDAVATAAGLALVATGLLEDWSRLPLLAFLAGSYGVWWLGLRVNLAANLDLLERAGTSTNLLSKAAYDLVRHRRGSLRARRLAAAAGYVGSELAKEAPYYLGAFATALVSDAVTADDALVFLAGANLGAAAYEYGLGRGVRALLGPPAYASFDTDWSPGDYLASYYRTVEPDERATIAFFVDAARAWLPGQPMLVFGVGPTLHHVFCAAPKAGEIHLGDYLPANLREIQRWLDGDPGAHDWRPFIRYTLQCEGVAAPSAAEIEARAAMTRSKVTRLLRVDLCRDDPLGDGGTASYPILVSAYCADSATGDRAVWRCYMRRIARLVRPDGMLLLAALRRCRGYRVGALTFPSADIDEDDVRAALAERFPPDRLVVAAHELGEVEAKGYAGIVLARAGGCD